MPELPDIAVYIEAISTRILHQPLEAIRLGSPFLLRTIDPQPAALQNHTVTQLRRLGKRIAIGLDNDHWLVLHLMIAGRLHWRKRGASIASRNSLLALDFPNGALLLTEAGSQRRASLYLTNSETALNSLQRHGIEPLDCTLEAFTEALRKENHTLKRSLTDPDLFSGIGNAYSDEILHRARLSPLLLTSKITDPEIARLLAATRDTLQHWITELRKEAANAFPEGVTAFREGMAVHGRYGLPCPDCGAKIQRIRYASNETNYCAKCQTGGRLLADRAMSRLLKEDYPRYLED
ncbi:MAG: formamidopyrimidine-DNA glycosylase [Acidobacteria bacterium]|nr:formamidopyrimidine-DNA glycosylase [Acidobacteriota bacterium]